MRFYLVLAANTAMGLLAGVLTGNAVSGSTQSPEDSASLPGLRDLDLPGVLSPQVERESPSGVNTSFITGTPLQEQSRLSESGALEFTKSNLQVREVAIPRQGLNTESGTQMLLPELCFGNDNHVAVFGYPIASGGRVRARYLQPGPGRVGGAVAALSCMA